MRSAREAFFLVVTFALTLVTRGSILSTNAVQHVHELCHAATSVLDCAERVVIARHAVCMMAKLL